ncbi:MAG TPA: hypothetical protein VEC18_06850 [Myxococcota bacterium]|nr:hypothetical protein [Myxococcota bacterium]
MERAQLEALAELRFCELAQAPDLEHPEHVGGRLARPRDVAIDFGLDVAGRPGRVGEHVVDRLLARPAQGVQSAVDDEARGASGLIGEHADLVERPRVEAELVREALRVERPALAEAALVEIARERVHPVAELERERALQVMARIGFVVEDGELARDRAPLGVDDRDVEDAGPRAVLRRWMVLAGAAVLAVGGVGLDLDARLGQRAERVEHALARGAERGARVLEHVVARAEREARLRAELRQQRRDALAREVRIHQRLHLGADGRDLREPERVDLRGRGLEGREVAHRGGVAALALWVRAHRDALSRARQVRLFEERRVALHGGRDLAVEHLAHARAECGVARARGGAEQRACVVEQRAALRDHRGHEPARRAEALVEPRAQILDLLIDIAREAREPIERLLLQLGGVDRLDLEHGGQIAVPARRAAHRPELVAADARADRRLERLAQDAVGHPVAAADRVGRVDALELVEPRLLARVPRGERRGRVVGEAIVARAGNAVVGAHLGMALEQCGEVFVGDRFDAARARCGLAARRDREREARAEWRPRASRRHRKSSGSVEQWDRISRRR